MQVDPVFRRIMATMKTREELINSIGALLLEEDPINLVPLGCPNTEYLPEAREFAERLSISSLANCTPEMVYEVFLKMFEEELDKDKCQAISDGINALLAAYY